PVKLRHFYGTKGTDLPGRPYEGRSPSMLVLSRQRDESIMIGDNIVITIVDIRGDKVRLGINAPTEIPVHRQEVYEAIQRENLRASRLEPKDTRGLDKGSSRADQPPWFILQPGELRDRKLAIPGQVLARACKRSHSPL